MIYGSMDVHWMRVYDGHTTFRKVGLLFQEYSNKEIVLDGNVREIRFDPNEIKITDWQGWTELLILRRIPARGKVLIGYRNPEEERDLECGFNTLIPIYDPTKSFKGFHGEVKHPFEVVTISEAMKRFNDPTYPDIFMRIRDNEDGLKKIDRFIIESINTHFYQLITKSGFYNTTNFGPTYYMWGREEIPTDYCAVCPVNNTQFCAKCRKSVT